MDCYFFTFNKRTTSTAIPTADGVRYEIMIRDRATLTAPVISLATVWDPSLYNYAWIPEWSRYYWIREWTYSSGLWFGALEVDVLASLRTLIRNSTQYVARSAAAYDPALADSRYPMQTPPTVNVYAPDRYVNPWDIDGMLASHAGQGTYIVGIINRDVRQVGCTTYYAFDPGQFEVFAGKMFESLNWVNGDTSGISEDLLKCLFNPFQYITQVYWCPIKFTAGAEINTIFLGYWGLTGVPCKLISNYGTGCGAIWSVPKHPQAARGRYLNSAPYTNYSIEWPVLGSIVLPGGPMAAADHVQMYVQMDVTTGDATVQFLDPDRSVLMFQTNIKLAVPISIANGVSDVLGAATSLLEGATSVVYGDMSGLVAGVVQPVEALIPRITTINRNGNMTIMAYNPTLQAEFHMIAEEDLADVGRPLCQNRQLSTIPGYLVCEHAHLEGPWLKSELEAAERMLEGGVYNE